MAKKTSDSAAAPFPRLRITTFGTFSVMLNGAMISDDARRQHKIWTLLKYILTNRHRRIPAEDFYPILWGNEHCDNPPKALQNLIYRVRMTLAGGVKEHGEAFIQFSKGCYYWAPTGPCDLDIDRFEEADEKGLRQDQSGRHEAAARSYLEALACFRGNFLSEDSSAGWIIAAANTYRRKLINLCNRSVRLMASLTWYEEILTACSAVLAVEPYEESLHAAYIDALCALGRNAEARRHYENTSVALYRSFGIRPSQVLREAFGRIDEAAGVNTDIDTLQDILAEQGDDSIAFICDPDMFRAIYKLEARRISRWGEVVYLVLLTLLDSSYRIPDARLLRPAMDLLCDVLLNTLRRGDVVSRWNDSQFIVMLSSLTYEDCEIVVRRVCDQFESLNKNPHGLHLQMKMSPVNVQD